MNINEFKKIEDEISEKSFIKSNKGMRGANKYISIFFNILSAFLAFVFLMKTITGIDDNIPTYLLIVLGILSGIIVSCIEYLKRITFRKIVIGFLNKNNSKIIGFGIFGLVLLVITSWFSIHGSSELANRTTKVKKQTENNIRYIKDSINRKYDTLNKENYNDLSLLKKELSENKKKLNEIQIQITEIYDEKKYVDNVKNSLKKEIIESNKKIENQILEIDKKIKTSNKERDEEIKKITKDNDIKLNEQMSNIESGQLKFILITIFIELSIIFGVGYVGYYDWKVYQEIHNTEEYKKYQQCIKMLNIIYLNGKAQDEDKIMSLEKFYDACGYKNISKSTAISFIDLLERLKIIRIVNQIDRVLCCDFPNAQQEIAKYFGFM